MPVHDWTRVDAGIFHHFHQQWIMAIANVLNERLLPRDYYALAEQQGVGFEPDVLTLTSGSTPKDEDSERVWQSSERNGGSRHAAVLTAEPAVALTAETDLDFYRRKQNVATVRHVSGDHLVAVVEIVSKGNKSGRKAFEDFVRKAAEFLQRQVHLLVVDIQPPTARDPQGIHGALWDEIAGESYARPADKPLTLAAYESGPAIRAFVQPVAVGDALIDMPLYLAPRQHVAVPLEETYQVAFRAVPSRWQAVIEQR